MIRILRCFHLRYSCVVVVLLFLALKLDSLHCQDLIFYLQNEESKPIVDAVITLVGDDSIYLSAQDGSVQIKLDDIDNSAHLLISHITYEDYTARCDTVHESTLVLKRITYDLDDIWVVSGNSRKIIKQIIQKYVGLTTNPPAIVGQYRYKTNYVVGDKGIYYNEHHGFFYSHFPSLPSFSESFWYSRYLLLPVASRFNIPMTAIPDSFLVRRHNHLFARQPNSYYLQMAERVFREFGPLSSKWRQYSFAVGDSDEFSEIILLKFSKKRPREGTNMRGTIEVDRKTLVPIRVEISEGLKLPRPLGISLVPAENWRSEYTFSYILRGNKVFVSKISSVSESSDGSKSMMADLVLSDFKTFEPLSYNIFRAGDEMDEVEALSFDKDYWSEWPIAYSVAQKFGGRSMMNKLFEDSWKDVTGPPASGFDIQKDRDTWRGKALRNLESMIAKRLGRRTR